MTPCIFIIVVVTDPSMVLPVIKLPDAEHFDQFNYLFIFVVVYSVLV